MAQYSLNAYDADVYIPEFKGLMQYGDQMGTDLRFSPDCMNVETIGGVLQPAPLLDGVLLVNSALTPVPTPTGKAGTLMFLRDSVPSFSGGGYTYVTAIYGDSSIALTNGAQYDTYLIASGGKVYKINFIGDLPEMRNKSINLSEVTMPDGITSFSSDQWSWCTYECPIIVGSSIPPGQTQPVYEYETHNILLMSNAKDGLFYYYNGAIKKITTAPKKFSHIAVYSERVWGCGAEDAQDTIYYSHPFDAMKWSQNNDIPEDGGGEIRLATWDTDKILSFVRYGDALIAFSKLRAWRITGTDPSNYIVQEQYGNGTLYPETVVVMDSYILMLGQHGLLSYDGYRTAPFMDEATHEFFRKIAPSHITGPKAVKIGDNYVLALSNEVPGTTQTYRYFDTSSKTKSVDTGTGYKLLVFNWQDNTIVPMDSPKVMSFCKGTGAMLYYSSENSQDVNRIAFFRPDSWNAKRITPNAVKWTTPWITLGRKDIQKGGFELYFTPEIDSTDTLAHQMWYNSNNTSQIESYPSVFDTTENGSSVTFKFSIQTEKKTKTKTYTVQKLTAEEIAAGKQYKQKRLHFGGGGRKFRLIIEVEAGNTVPWRLVGGIHMIAEIDRD